MQSQLSMGNIGAPNNTQTLEQYRRHVSGMHNNHDTTGQSNFFMNDLTKNEENEGHGAHGGLGSAFRAARNQPRDDDTAAHGISDFDITEALDTNAGGDRAAQQNISGLLRATDTRQTQVPNHYDAFETSKDHSELIVDGDRRAADVLLDEQDDGGATAAANFARDRPPIHRREKAPEPKMRQLSEVERQSIGNNRNDDRYGDAGAAEPPALLWPSQVKGAKSEQILKPADE